MQEAAVGTAPSGSIGGAGAGEMGAGLQMDDTGALTEAEEDASGGVKGPLLSEPLLSLAGEDFFFTGLTLVVLLCCCRHLARRFLNQT